MLPASGAWALNDVMAQRAPPELFADEGILDAIEPEPAAILRNVRRPQAQLLDLLADHG